MSYAAGPSVCINVKFMFAIEIISMFFFFRTAEQARYQKLAGTGKARAIDIELLNVPATPKPE